MKQEQLTRLRADLALRGLSRGQAARRLYLSPGALNKKLRGEKPLYPGERQALEALCRGREEAPRP